MPKPTMTVQWESDLGDDGANVELDGWSLLVRSRDQGFSGGGCGVARLTPEATQGLIDALTMQLEVGES